MFTFNIHLHGHVAVEQINQQLQQIRMKITEALDIIKASKEQATKAKTEILAKIDSLSTAGTLTPEQEAIVTELKASTQALDDIVPDVTPEPTA